MKLLYHKTIGNRGKLHLDEMYTVLCQIEAVQNSRQITTISDDAKDTVRLTPSMLLKGLKSTQLSIVADPTIDEIIKYPETTIELPAQTDCRILEEKKF